MSRYLRDAEHYAKSIQDCYDNAGALGYRDAEYAFQRLKGLIGRAHSSKNDKADVPLITEMVKTARPLMDEMKKRQNEWLRNAEDQNHQRKLRNGHIGVKSLGSPWTSTYDSSRSGCAFATILRRHLTSLLQD